ncbi:MAG: ABC transporter substrate-binding protein [Candidatus Rokubacteria bacterium]|nr:ABC transporter substrate-binding protein [Candidatus Rokubacteria bacterium]MBI3108948.1 ABC transporter substrate-binding protein [Candidatus Rokubacteria bacterium]
MKVPANRGMPLARAAVGALLLVSAGLVGESLAAGPAKIRVGGRSEPLIIAEGKGWFAQEGVEVEVTEVRNFMQYPILLASGNIDLLDGYLPPNFWNMIIEGASFRIVAGSALAVAARGNEPARNVRGYVVRKDLYDSGAVKSVKDLEGRKLADFAPVPPKGQISPFPIGHKVFGESFRHINWVRVANEADILRALEQKDVDGARMRTRWVKLAVKKGLAVELVKETDFVPEIQVRALAGPQAFLAANREAVVRFLRVYLRAQQYAREVQQGKHTEEYLSFVKKFSDVPSDLALELLQEVEITDRLALDDLLDTQKHFVMVRSQKQVIPLESIVDMSYLNAAKK